MKLENAAKSSSFTSNRKHMSKKEDWFTKSKNINLLKHLYREEWAKISSYCYANLICSYSIGWGYIVAK